MINKNFSKIQKNQVSGKTKIVFKKIKSKNMIFNNTTKLKKLIYIKTMSSFPFIKNPKQ